MALSDDTYRTPCQDTYESLLMGYAFGVLDRAQSLIVASHLLLSPKARALTSACEHMAGALLERDCPPTDMRPGALERVLSALDSGPCADGTCKPCAEGLCLPEELGTLPGPVIETLSGAPEPFAWKPLGSGFCSYDLALKECASKARFMKLDPGTKTPQHGHGGIEITLVLGGAVMEEGDVYRRGDLLVADETLTHTQQSCPKAGCVCMVVTSAPVKLTGLASVLNPFLKP